MKKRMFSIMSTSKKKSINVIFCTALIVALGIGFTACDSGNDLNGSPVGGVPVTQNIDNDMLLEVERDLASSVDNNTSVLAASVALFSGGGNDPDALVESGSTIRFGGIEWRVLDIKGDNALIISDKILSKKAYNSESAAVTWEECDLREYLNGIFYDSVFSADEKNRILETAVINNDNSWGDAVGGNDTTDKIFLLSIDEAVKYFNDNTELENPKNGVTTITDQFNERRIAEIRANTSAWWLRSSGSHNSDVTCAANVAADGSIDVNGEYVNNSEIGVRPAIWINAAELGVQKWLITPNTDGYWAP